MALSPARGGPLQTLIFVTLFCVAPVEWDALPSALACAPRPFFNKTALSPARGAHFLASADPVSDITLLTWGQIRVACAEDDAKMALSPARGGICQNCALACARCSLFYKTALSPRRGAHFVMTGLKLSKMIAITNMRSRLRAGAF